MHDFFNSPQFTWIVLPLLIFGGRICDVTLGTIRIIFVSRGRKKISALLGFFEVLIWLLAISQIMQHLDNVFCYIAYPAGFAMGNYIGISIEEKLALGLQEIRVITNHDDTGLLAALKAEGFGTTHMEAQGSMGAVEVIYLVIKRSSLPKVISLIDTYNPGAFYSVEDVRIVRSGVFPTVSKSTKYIPRFYKRK